MSVLVYLFFGIVALLLVLFTWSVRKPGRGRISSYGAAVLEESGQRHMAYLPQIRQALARNDLEFLSGRVARGVQRRVRRERCRVALAYVSALREDFERLLRIARVIAVLSPEVAAVQEFERIRLTMKFAWRYHAIRLKLLAGYAPAPQLGRLSDFVSGLSVRMELAIKELGERAALARGLDSSLNRRGVDAD